MCKFLPKSNHLLVNYPMPCLRRASVFGFITFSVSPCCVVRFLPSSLTLQLSPLDSFTTCMLCSLTLSPLFSVMRIFTKIEHGRFHWKVLCRVVISFSFASLQFLIQCVCVRLMNALHFLFNL